METDLGFSTTQIERYARHILLPEIGGAGQTRLLQSKVLIVGAGGLGSPVALYLAAAGIGTIGMIDPDVVDRSNLQRQILHTDARIGMEKVHSARQSINAIAPDVTYIAHAMSLDGNNAMDVIAPYDVVVDGTDNFATRYLLNDACYFARVPLVSAAILRFDGQLSTWKAWAPLPNDMGAQHGPCYRCIFRNPPAADVPSCAEAGVLGALCGVMGSLQATEVIKELLAIGQSLSGTLVLYEGLSATFQRIQIKADPTCPLCGTVPEIHDLTIHRDADGSASA